jgi:hypothetical protein
MGSSVRLWLGWWAACAALWLCLAGKLTAQNAVAAALVAALVATMRARASRLGLARFRPDPAWWPVLGRLPRQVLGDTATVLGAAVRGPSGGSESRVPFDPGGPDARSAARRALVVTGVSLPPNSLVLEVEPDALLVHQLEPAPPPGHGDREWPL